MPRPLPDELLEEVLRRLPPEEPAELVRAALVSRRWCRLVSDPGFRRRFREFHRSPPMLGMLVNSGRIHTTRFIPTTAFCTPRTDFQDMSVLDARHGRVLYAKRCHCHGSALCANAKCVNILAVWDPIANEVRELPFLENKYGWCCRTAAILCSAAGACDHLECHHGPFLVVYVCINEDGNPILYTYSSDAASWSEPVIGQDHIFIYRRGSALVGNAVYFQYYDQTGSTTLKYNFELHQMSMIQLPPSLSLESLEETVLLTTTEEGGLGLIHKDDTKLYLWSRKDTHEVDAIWERRVTIELNTVFAVDVVWLSLVAVSFS